MKKKILQTVLFLGIMFLTFYTLLHGQNLSEIYQAVKNMSVPYLIAAAGLALFFVCAEGSMIWYLLTSMRKKTDSQTTVLCVVGKEKVFEADMLFATLDVTLRKATLPNKRDFLVVDTVGFVSKLPHD